MKPDTGALVPWFGCARLIAPQVGAELRGCRWVGIPFGGGTARVGVRIDRAVMSIEQADTALCGRRLNGKIVVGPKDESTSQTHLLPGLKHEIDGSFDVKRFAVSPKNITAGLTFALKGLAIEELAHFAKKSGRLLIDTIEDIPVDVEEDDDDDEVHSSGFRSPESGGTGRWRDRPLQDLPGLKTRTKRALLAACEAKGIATIGGLSSLMEKHGSWWQRELAGIGDKAAEEISEAFVDFWATHPEYCCGADATDDADDSDVIDEEPAEAEEVAR